jgi:hypothetical protein
VKLEFLMSQAPTRIVTSMFRASYPHLWTPRPPSEGAAPKFSLACLIPPEPVLAAMSDGEKLVQDRRRFMKELTEAIAAAKTKTFGANPPPNLPMTIYKAEEKGKGECYEPGWTLIRASAPADKRPAVLLAKRDPATGKWLPCPQEDFYAGCWARASIDVYGYTKPNKGISVGLNFVQKIKDGDRLDNRPVAEDEFDDLDFGAGEAGGQTTADALFG